MDIIIFILIIAVNMVKQTKTEKLITQCTGTDNLTIQYMEVFGIPQALNARFRKHIFKASISEPQTIPG